MRNDVPVDYQMIGVAGSALDDVVVPGGRSEHET
jgi:hypothetical protein